ncbi:MAG: methyltransferase family protein [Candidatus Helarchaeota archaeon]
MSLLWILRIIFIMMLYLQILIGGFFLSNREKYNAFLNNRPLNIFFVILYNIFCYLSAGLLPADPSIFKTPIFFNSIIISCGFQILGIALLFFGIFLLIKTIQMRKSVGAEETAQGLITTGVYSYFRHPIYTGICLISFAIALNAINLDGFIILPLILLANLIQAKIEEKYDVGVVFKEEYVIYRKKTQIFGPIWFWSVIVFYIFIIIGIAYSTYTPTLFDFFSTSFLNFN